MIKKLFYPFLFILPSFLFAQKTFTLQADYVCLGENYGELYFLHQKQAGFQIFYSNFKRKNIVFEQFVEREDTVSLPSPTSVKGFFKPEERLLKQTVKQLMLTLEQSAFEVETKITKTVWQMMSKNIISKSEYEKDTSNTYQLESRRYFHYVITVLNGKHPFVSVRESDKISEEVAALLPTNGVWQLYSDSLQSCKKVTRLTDFLIRKNRCDDYYNEDNFSDFNVLFKKKGKFGLIDTNLQMIMIPPIYDSLYFLKHYIVAKKVSF